MRSLQESKSSDLCSFQTWVVTDMSFVSLPDVVNRSGVTSDYSSSYFYYAKYVSKHALSSSFYMI